MATRTLDPETEARVKSLSARVDRELDADRRFFERRPRRRHRVRRLYQAEGESTCLIAGWEWPAREDAAFYAAVRQIAPGVRVRCFFAASPEMECDLSEDAAAAIFDRANRSAVAEEVERLYVARWGGEAE